MKLGALVPLSSITHAIQYGYTTKSASDTSGPKYLRITDIQDSEVDWSDVPHCEIDDADLKRYYLKPCDVVFARSGATVGKSFLIDGAIPDSVFASYLIRVTFDDTVIYPRYGYYFFQSPQYWQQITEGATGTGQPNFNGTKLGALRVPVPPLPEQRRVIAKLDALIARSRRARDELACIPRMVERYKQAILDAAFRGDLTVQWRKENRPTAWRRVTVREIADAIFDGPFGSHLKTDDYSSSGALVIRLENIGPLQFRGNKRTYIPLEKYAGLSRHTLHADDILLSSFVDESVRVCLFPNDLGDAPAINKADCFCVRVNRAICLPEFLALTLYSAASNQYMRGQVHGATRPRINLGHLKKFSFELPDLDEQQEIVRRVTGTFSSVDAVVTRREHVGLLLDHLNEAILAKAFDGELIAQNLSRSSVVTTAA